jgi:hypothetical protein
MLERQQIVSPTNRASSRLLNQSAIPLTVRLSNAILAVSFIRQLSITGQASCAVRIDTRAGRSLAGRRVASHPDSTRAFRILAVDESHRARLRVKSITQLPERQITAGLASMAD